MPHCQIPMERCRNDSCMYLQPWGYTSKFLFWKTNKNCISLRGQYRRFFSPSNKLLYQVILQWKPFYPLTRRGSFKNYLNQTPSPLNTPLPSCLIAIHGQEYPLPREPVMFSRPKMFGKIKKPKFYIICCLSTALLAICLKCQINCQVSCQNYSGVVPLHALSQYFQQNVIS